MTDPAKYPRAMSPNAKKYYIQGVTIVHTGSPLYKRFPNGPYSGVDRRKYIYSFYKGMVGISQL